MRFSFFREDIASLLEALRQVREDLSENEK